VKSLTFGSSFPLSGDPEEVKEEGIEEYDRVIGVGFSAE
jgi:hypothetical protein